MKKLRIAQIAPIWFPIPPRKYGGTERIVHYLTEGLVKKGHKVTLFASGDSKTRARLSFITRKSLTSRGISWQDWWWHNFHYFSALERAGKFDIIHSHWTPLGLYFQKFIKTPILNTFHNIPKKTDHRWPTLKYYKNSNVVFISEKQKRNSPVRFKKEWVVYNGIDVSQFKFNSQPENLFIWIGRICPDKGTKNAVVAARKLGINLLLAGQLQPMYKDFFKKEIRPYLGRKIRYIGELSQNQLSDFYGPARAFIYPLTWQEPFGLCMIESMACGTPVIAFNLGSVPEVVKDGKTGFVVNPLNKKGKVSIEGFVEAIKKIDKIERRECRKWVEENFTIQKMVENYEKIYYQILKL